VTTGMTNFTPELLAELKRQSKADFYFFAKSILGFDWLVPHIHLPICELMEDYETNNRLRIVLPRSWLKSTLCTIAYPIWRAIRDPNIRVCVVQNSHTNATKKLAVIRGKFESCPLFRALFPELLPDKTCTWTNDSLCIKRTTQNAESTFEAAGTRTKLTSRHYDLIIEDDTVAPDLDDMTEGALLPSEEDVQQAIGWHRNALPLLVDSKRGQILIVGTRWFEKDLISWNTENEPQYKGYMRAVRETNGIPDESGELTYPERFDAQVLKELHQAMGDYLYSTLYMNKPIRSTDMTFQPHWFKYYDVEPRDLICYTTVDLAGDPAEQKGDPDWNVVMTCGKDLMSGKIYVLNYFRARCTPSELIQAVFEHVRMYKPVKVGIESVQYQSSMLYWVRERMRQDNLYFMVEGMTYGKRSKNSRISSLQPLVQAGLLLFRPHHRPLVTELLAFPLAAYDDLGDALSMQLPMWAMTKSVEEEKRDNPVSDPFLFEHAERELESRDLKKTLALLDSPYGNIRPLTQQEFSFV
jgi:predicted phage terminase large subunit-like protein